MFVRMYGDHLKNNTSCYLESGLYRMTSLQPFQSMSFIQIEELFNFRKVNIRIFAGLFCGEANRFGRKSFSLTVS